MWTAVQWMPAIPHIPALIQTLSTVQIPALTQNPAPVVIKASNNGTHFNTVGGCLVLHIHLKEPWSLLC